MNHYFMSVLDTLNLEDIEVLNKLTSKDAVNVATSIKKKLLFDELNISQATFRKVLYRLEAMQFVKTVSGNKEHSIYATEYGQQVIQTFSERGFA